MAIKSIDLRTIEHFTGNIYEAVNVIGRRGRMINSDNRLEFRTLVESVIPVAEDEFDERDNSEQIKISVEFEKRPKAHEQALEELIDGKLEYRFKD